MGLKTIRYRPATSLSWVVFALTEPCHVRTSPVGRQRLAISTRSIMQCMNFTWIVAMYISNYQWSDSDHSLPYMVTKSRKISHIYLLLLSLLGLYTLNLRNFQHGHQNLMRNHILSLAFKQNTLIIFFSFWRKVLSLKFNIHRQSALNLSWLVAYAKLGCTKLTKKIKKSVCDFHNVYYNDCFI